MKDRLRSALLGLGVLALAGVVFATMASEPTYGRQLSASEASEVQGGGDCKDWVHERCRRPGVSGCYSFLCWRWTDAVGDYDNDSPGEWCCTQGHACDQVVFVQYPCVYTATP